VCVARDGRRRGKNNGGSDGVAIAVLLVSAVMLSTEREVGAETLSEWLHTRVRGHSVILSKELEGGEVG